MHALTRTMLAVSLFAASAAASATGTLRCNTHIIEQGTPRDQVVSACGEPTLRKDGDTYWFYEHDSSLLLTRVYFVGDKVEFIDEVRRDEM